MATRWTTFKGTQWAELEDDFMDSMPVDTHKEEVMELLQELGLYLKNVYADVQIFNMAKDDNVKVDNMAIIDGVEDDIPPPPPGAPLVDNPPAPPPPQPPQAQPPIEDDMPPPPPGAPLVDDPQAAPPSIEPAPPPPPPPQSNTPPPPQGMPPPPQAIPLRMDSAAPPRAQASSPPPAAFVPPPPQASTLAIIPEEPPLPPCPPPLLNTIHHGQCTITVTANHQELIVTVSGKTGLSNWQHELWQREEQHRDPILHPHDSRFWAYSVHHLNGGRLVISAQNTTMLSRIERYALHALFLHLHEDTTRTGLLLIDELVRWFEFFKFPQV